MATNAPKEFICPVTKEVMRDPVVSPLGISFERDAIIDWVNKHECCPVEGFPLDASELRTNTKLQWKIRYWLAKNKRSQATSAEEANAEDQRPLDHFICPLTNSVMMDPVTTRSGQNYEREALEKFIQRHGSICPFSGKPLGQPGFYANKALAREIKQWMEACDEEDTVVASDKNGPTSVDAVEEINDSNVFAPAQKTRTIIIPGSKVSAQVPVGQRTRYIHRGVVLNASFEDQGKDVLSILDEVCRLELSA